ncbi:HNH endonuclease [Aldersonia sp. NBC_00410]|uniref:HNH endonuclease signature motif containing protein n=1 Tax=Aldersonia sp. NBC_00410 TaxID=2975954 RepID=UPI002258F916|nr:HNH endonuclease signature motif containing protein [Aldersonia sp. NBC_00410]MCX5043529.1 HNH endonuclease [Aldersonia sp. NBC_00410]
MFETLADTTSDAELLAALAANARAENRAAFAKVDMAGQFYARWMERVILCGTDVIRGGNNGLAEIAVRLGVSKTTAEHFAELGVGLQSRLPLVRAAFAEGDIDYSKALRISHATGGFSADVVALVEPEAIAAARRLAPAALATTLDTLLIRTAPEEYATLRDAEHQISRRIRTRRLGYLHRVEADLDPAEAAAVLQRVQEVAATVCEHDQRGKQYRLVDAYLALIHGEDVLQCTCGRNTCAATRTAPSRGTAAAGDAAANGGDSDAHREAGHYVAEGEPDPPVGSGFLRPAAPIARRKPLVQITVDIATLLGLTAEPAYLPGFGPIDPEMARMLASDATWQAMLTELLDLAGRTVTSAPPTATRVANFVARGTRRHAGLVPPMSHRENRPHTQPRTTEPVGDTALLDHLTALLEGQPDLARGQYPDGHGGFTTAPPGALTYRPSADVTALVRARDRRCRFPSCTVPADRCQLDHVTPFDHQRPDRGGWTIPSNLQCLCRFHHQLKTAGQWTAAALPAAAMLWTSSYGTCHITLPEGGLNAVPAATLTPKVGAGPQTWRPPRRRVTYEPAPF